MGVEEEEWRSTRGVLASRLLRALGVALARRRALAALLGWAACHWRDTESSRRELEGARVALMRYAFFGAHGGGGAAAPVGRGGAPARARTSRPPPLRSSPPPSPL